MRVLINILEKTPFWLLKRMLIHFAYFINQCVACYYDSCYIGINLSMSDECFVFSVLGIRSRALDMVGSALPPSYILGLVRWILRAMQYSMSRTKGVWGPKPVHHLVPLEAGKVIYLSGSVFIYTQECNSICLVCINENPCKMLFYFTI